MVDRPKRELNRPSLGYSISGEPVGRQKLWFILAALENLTAETMVDVERIGKDGAAHFPDGEGSSDSVARLRDRRLVKLGEARGVYMATQFLRAQLDPAYNPDTISRARIERDFRSVSTSDGQRLEERKTQLAPEVAEEIYRVREMEAYQAEVPAEVRNAKREDLSE